MKIILLLLLSSLSACCTDRLVYIDPQPYNLQRTQEVPPVAVRVHNDDVGVYNAFIDSLRDKLKFHDEQITDYENSFKEDEQ